MWKKHRTASIVLLVLAAHIVLISAQLTVESGRTVLDAVVFGTLTEAQRLAAGATGLVRGGWNGYVGLHTVSRTNRDLEAEVAALRYQLQQQHALVQQARGLERLLELRESVDLDTLSARVIGADASPWFRTLTIDRGSRDFVHADLAVLAPEGVVGRIVGRPGLRAAQVQLLIDRNAAAGALIERTRAVGIVVGQDDPAVFSMEYVSNQEDVAVGDRVIASGADGIFPHGFTIGTVAEVTRGPELYKHIRVTPAVDFARIEQVLIVLDNAGSQMAEDLR